MTGATQALRTSTGIIHAGLKHVVDCIGGELLPGVAHRFAPASPALPAVALGRFLRVLLNGCGSAKKYATFEDLTAPDIRRDTSAASEWHELEA